MDRNEAKALVVKAGRELVKSGLIARTWGNVSGRIDENTFVITPSGRDYLTLREEEIVEVKMKDVSYEGKVKPSSEKRLHREIYKHRPEVEFIIHTHQENGSAVAAMPIDVLEFGRTYPGIGSQVRCARYALPGTKKFAGKVVEALKESTTNAILLKYHGVVCFGKTCEEAFQAAQGLEEACEAYLDDISPAIQRSKGERREEGARPGEIWNRDPLVLSFLELETDLLPFSEDYAQMVGERARFVTGKKGKRTPAVLVRGKGALCTAETEEDARAIAILVKKNVKAFYAASAMGKAKPIGKIDTALMRAIYVKKYAKLKGD